MNSKNIIAGIILLVGIFMILVGLVRLGDRLDTGRDVVIVLIGLSFCICG
jgi:MFS superfamily sulfate permease-like transporter